MIDNQSNNVVANANLANDDFLVWEQGNLMPDSEYTITVTSMQHVKQLENTVVLRTLKVPSMPDIGIRDVRSTTVELFWTRAQEWDQNAAHIVTPMFLELVNLQQSNGVS